MTQTKARTDTKARPADRFVEHYRNFAPQRGAEHAALQALREKAIEQFNDRGFPQRRDEEWKYTSTAPITRNDFAPAKPLDDKVAAGLAADNMARLVLSDSWIRLAFVDGHFAAALSSLGGIPEGVTVKSLRAALGDGDPVEEHLGKALATETKPFAALNTAFIQDGVYIRIPRGQRIERPIHLLFASSGAASTVSFPRVLVVVEESAEATMIEDYAALADESAKPYFTNAALEVFVAANAHLDHYKFEHEANSGFHVGTTAIEQESSSVYRSHSITLGGALVRNEIDAGLRGEGAECTLNGLLMISGKQHVDNHTRIDHARPHCNSWQVYKNILDGQATGVFNGKIHVAQDAQKTDAKQTNQSLLLSDGALMNSKPELEIYADDVKCTHGATIGQLDKESLFYLRTRGIGSEAAESLLTFAFAGEVVQGIKVDELRDRLHELLFSRLPSARSSSS